MHTDQHGFQAYFKAWFFLSAFIGVHLWFISPASAQDAFVWWEGEHATSTNVPERSPFSPGDDGNFDVLSGGDWISGVVKAGGRPYEATYRVTVPRAGTYELWARKFWKHGPFVWRFGEQPWRTAGRDVALADSAPIRKHLVANWVGLGSVTLPAGATTFTWRMTDLKPGKDEAVAFDCFVLSAEPFAPRGKLKPGQHDAHADPGYFAWDPPTDPFPDDAGFDHRNLNEEFAGIHGRVRASPDGNSLQLGDATPVRFWGVNVQVEMGALPDALLEYHARKLAKLGVNLVRIHGPLWDESPDGPRPLRIDPEQLDRVHRLVAAYKKQGIYVNLSWYFPVWIDAHDAGLKGYRNSPDPHPFATAFFDPDVQRWYFDSLRTIMTTPNPHTGMTLAEDPAVAFVEMVNEDSFFFWTFNDGVLPASKWRVLQKLYETSPHYAGGKLHEAWRMTTDGFNQASGRDRKRIQAQAAFLADTQRAFYAKGKAFLRDLGYDGLTIASNWHTADPGRLDALERWTYTAADVIDHHGYFEGKHEGDGSSYSVRVEHTYQDREALRNLGSLPLRVNQVAGKPQMISEINWPLPNRYRADMVWLGVAALGVQGVDAVCWFAVTTPTLNDASSRKFTLDVPSIAGQFPAAALAFRRGDVPEQPPTVVESLRSEDLKALSGSATAGKAALDQLRAADVPDDQRAKTGGRDATGVHRLSYYAGPVVRRYDDRHTKTHTAADLHAKVSDRGVSIPGLLHMPGDGTMEITGTGRHHVWAGRPTRAPLRSDATVIDPNPGAGASGGASGASGASGGGGYGSFAAISLDGRPLAESQRVLLQALAGEQPFGYRADRHRITALGGSPLNVKPAEVRFTWTPKKNRPTRAVVLDENGNRTERAVEVTRDGASLSFAWPAGTIYVLLEAVDP